MPGEGRIAVPAKHPALCSAAVILATMLYSIDWTIAAVALPHMRGAFSATQDQISWVITSYIVASAVMLPTASFMSARFGRRQLFITAVAGFIAASAACGLADSLAAEVVARIIQGMFGAFLVPMSQAIVLDTYPPEKHTRMMGFWGMGSVFGPVLGPTLGGYLTEFADWRWIFFINVPLGLIALAGVIAFLPESKREPGRRLDWFGFLSLSLGIGALQMMLDRGERQDWFESTEILLEGALAVLGLYLFAVHSLTTRNPFLDTRLLAVRGFVFGIGFVFIYGMITVPTMVLMPPFMQDLRGMPVDLVGMLQSPRGVGLVISMFAGGMLTSIVGPRLLIGFGFTCLAIAGFEMSTWTLEVGPWPIAWTGLLQGIGAGVIWVPLQTVVFPELRQEQRTEAASILNLMRSLGSSIGISLTLTLLTRTAAETRASLAEHVTPFNNALRHSDVARHWDIGSVAGLSQLQREVELQASMAGYAADFRLLAAGAVLALPLLLFLRPAGAKAKPAPPPAG